MHFTRTEPSAALQKTIECFWMATDDDANPRKVKIIPDGFTEVIFHLGDLYRICLRDQWEQQSRSLLAGQISRHFYLENTGTSAMVGIKFKPTALASLYGLNMNSLTDTVVDLHVVGDEALAQVEREVREAKTDEETIAVLESYFAKRLDKAGEFDNRVEQAVDAIMTNKGMVSVKQLCEIAGVGERQLENLFKRLVGLSPKFYARIIRFGYIFDLVQQNAKSWSDLAYEAAFYDQSHFIRNFRSFTGENPADYAFNEKNMANFFLKKSKE